MLWAPPAAPVAAGSPIIIWVYCVNDATGAVAFDPPPHYQGRLSWPSGAADVALVRVDPRATTVAVAPGAFLKVGYSVAIPAEAVGRATLEVGTFERLAFAIEPADAAAAGPPPTAVRPPEAVGGRQVKAAPVPAGSLEEPLFGRFINTRVSFFEPIYFLLGTAPSAEFQFSLKARLIDVPDWGSFANHLYFGYSQTSFWTLLTHDPYFYDSSYRPSVFYYTPIVKIPHFTSDTTHLGIQSGFEHESNGRGGTNERSLNTVYFQPTLTLGPLDDWHLTLQPRVWYYLTVGEYNRDLAAYKGYASLRTFLTKGDFQVATRVTMGDRDRHVSGLLDVTFRLPKDWGWNTAFQVQAFEGYDQTLIDYNRVDHGLRAGINLWFPRYEFGQVQP